MPKDCLCNHVSLYHGFFHIQTSYDRHLDQWSVYIFIFSYVFIYVCLYVMYVCMYACMHALFVCVLCMYVYICMCV